MQPSSIFSSPEKPEPLPNSRTTVVKTSKAKKARTQRAHVAPCSSTSMSSTSSMTPCFASILDADACMCIMCNERPRDVIFMPCGHRVLCQLCSSNVHAHRDAACAHCGEGIDVICNL